MNVLTVGIVKIPKEPWISIKSEDILQRLETDENNGLTTSEAKHRLEEFGPNALQEDKERFRILKLVVEQFKDLFVVMLLAACVISFVLGEITDAITIAAIVVICAVIGFIQEYRAEKALEAMKKLTAPTTRVMRDGHEIIIPSKEVVPGDIMLLEEGDRISADGVLFKHASLRINEAPLTGESTPVSKELGVLDIKTPVADRKNSVFTGTHVVFGRGKVVVTGTGMNTEFGKIAGAVEEIKAEKTPLEAKLDAFAKKVAWLIIGLCVAIFVLEALEFGLEPKILVTTFMVAVSLAISAVPEALPALVVVTLALGAQGLAKQKALIRKLASAETLGSTTFVCADKTGTLTKGEMAVRKIYTNFKIIKAVEMGYEHDAGSVDVNNDSHITMVLRIGALCNNAVLDGQKSIGDPTEVALVASASKAKMQKDELEKLYPRIEEIPFSSERKLMTTIHSTPEGGRVAYVKGAPEVVLKRCTHIFNDNRVSEITEKQIKEILETNEKMASEALRILGMAYRELSADEQDFTEENVERGLIFVGLQGMIDPPRKETIEAIKVAERAGIINVMITGDHKQTAMAIAEELGILEEGELALTGTELDEMSDEEFEKVVEKVAVYARVSPMHKLRIIDMLKRRGHIVAMTGDGVNDAPALKKSDIGVAMGITGTDVSKEASDMVLADDNYATLIKALEWGRNIYENIRKYVRFLLACNFDELLVIGSMALARLPIPILPSQILWINLVTDGPPAIALSVDPPEKGLMDRPPRRPKAGIFHGMLSFIVASFLCQSIGSLSLFLYGYFVLKDLAVARTMVFLQAALFELFVIWNCRSEKHSVWKMGREALKNRFFVLATLASTALTFALPYIPVLSTAFEVVPLTPFQWAITIGAASLGLFVVLPELWMGRKIFGHV